MEGERAIYAVEMEGDKVIRKTRLGQPAHRKLALEQAVALAACRAPFERTPAADVVKNATLFEEFLCRPEPDIEPPAMG